MFLFLVFLFFPSFFFFFWSTLVLKWLPLACSGLGATVSGQSLSPRSRSPLAANKCCAQGTQRTRRMADLCLPRNFAPVNVVAPSANTVCIPPSVGGCSWPETNKIWLLYTIFVLVVFFLLCLFCLSSCHAINAFAAPSFALVNANNRCSVRLWLNKYSLQENEKKNKTKHS